MTDFDPYEFMLKMNEDIQLLKKNIDVIVTALNERSNTLGQVSNVITNNTHLIWTLEERIKILEEHIL